MNEVFVPVLITDEFTFVLEQFVVLGNVLGENNEGEENSPLHVRVIRTRHCSIDRLIGTGDERFVTFDVMGDIRHAVTEGMLVEDTKALVDGPTGILDLGLNRCKLERQGVPVFWVGRGTQKGLLTFLAVIRGAADFKVEIQSVAIKLTVLVTGNIEYQLVAV